MKPPHQTQNMLVYSKEKGNFYRYVENAGADNLVFKAIFKADAPEYAPRARTAHASLCGMYAGSPRRGPASGGCPSASHPRRAVPTGADGTLCIAAPFGLPP